MATRFGARSPFETYVAKVRWLVGGLLSLVIILTASVAYIAASATTPSEAVQTVPVKQAAENADAYIDVLTIARRVESGQQLEEYHFHTQPFPRDTVPSGVVLAADIDSVRGKYAGSMLRVGYPLTYEEVKLTPPFSVLDIPEGYRAVTIEASARELVAGHVTPNSRVDVLWKHKDRRGRGRIKPIVKFAKILSVNGEIRTRERTKVGGKRTTATLLVTAREAQMVELARSLGSLSLVLLGNGDNGALVRNAEEVTEDELYGRTEEEQLEPDYTGQLIVADPATGKPRRYLLTDRWRLDTTY